MVVSSQQIGRPSPYLVTRIPSGITPKYFQRELRTWRLRAGASQSSAYTAGGSTSRGKIVHATSTHKHAPPAQTEPIKQHPAASSGGALQQMMPPVAEASGGAAALLQRCRRSMEYEAASGYVDVVSPMTGRRFSGALAEQLVALRLAGALTDSNGATELIAKAGTYASMSRSDRHDFLASVKTGLRGSGGASPPPPDPPMIAPRQSGQHTNEAPAGAPEGSSSGRNAEDGSRMSEPAGASVSPQSTAGGVAKAAAAVPPPPLVPIPIAFDLETTGWNPSSDRITEIGAFAPLSGSRYQQLVSTSKWMSPTVVKLTGITREMLEGPEATDLQQALLGFSDFVNAQITGPGQVPILVAHNGRRFDCVFLGQEAKRMGLRLPRGWLFLDSLGLAKDIEGSLRGAPNMKLEGLREHFGLPEAGDAHRALADATVLSDVLAALLTKFQRPEKALLDNSFEVDEEGKALQGRLLDPSKLLRGDARRLQPSSSSSVDTGAPPAAEEMRPPASRSTSAPQPLGEQEPKAEATAAQRRPPKASSAASRASTTSGSSSNCSSSAGGDGGLETLGTFSIPISNCKHLTPTQRRKLQEEGFTAVEELLVQHLPRTYIDWQENVLVDGATVALTGYVLKNNVYHKGNLSILKLVLSVRPGHVEDPEEKEGGGGGSSSSGDEQGIDPKPPPEGSISAYDGYKIVVATKFLRGGYARPAMYKLSAKAMEGTMTVVKGKLSALPEPDKWELKGDLDVMTQAEWSQKNCSSSSISSYSFDEDVEGGRQNKQMQPVYAAVKSVSSKDFEKILPRALEAMEAGRCREDPLPADVVDRLGLMSWADAIRSIHQPSSQEEAEAARQRLAFQELFMLQMGLMLRRKNISTSTAEDGPDEGEEKRPAAEPEALERVEEAKAFLPFKLTRGQEESLAEVLEDLKGHGPPMLRLLQGDVGSGKTIVAFLAMLSVACSGGQVALMAPTEVLATQHKRNLDALLQELPGMGGISVALLTGSTRTAPRREILEGLSDGSLDVIIGTHSLISSSVDFKGLRLAVVDEQHRFGVEQRSSLQGAGDPPPHVLYLSATPIPRTLALVAHGEMDISVINERPPGRTAIQTKVLPGTDTSRDQAYSLIRRELQEGFRSYVICPLVETSEADGFEELKAAEDEFARLQEGGCLGDARCGLLHGRLSGEEKARALREFADGATQVLIATSVVEVGVDVPEASVMVVEHAERFGLAQLHQLRGRIGRGTRPGVCVLLVSGGEKATARVKVLEESQDGFEIAEADLSQRGPGEILGTRQSGSEAYAALQVTRLPQDAELLEAARDAAADLLQSSASASDIPMRLWAAYSAAAPPELDFVASADTILSVAASKQSQSPDAAEPRRIN